MPIHQCQYTNANPPMSIYQCQYTNVNTLISIYQCQYTNVSTPMSVHQCQYTNVLLNHCVNVTCTFYTYNVYIIIYMSMYM